MTKEQAREGLTSKKETFALMAPIFISLGIAIIFVGFFCYRFGACKQIEATIRRDNSYGHTAVAVTNQPLPMAGAVVQPIGMQPQQQMYMQQQQQVVQPIAMQQVVQPIAVAQPVQFQQQVVTAPGVLYAPQPAVAAPSIPYTPMMGPLGPTGPAAGRFGYGLNATRMQNTLNAQGLGNQPTDPYGQTTNAMANMIVRMMAAAMICGPGCCLILPGIVFIFVSAGVDVENDYWYSCP